MTMSTVESRSSVSRDDLLKGAAQLEMPDLEQFVAQVLALRANRIAPSLPGVEAELLQRINGGLPAEARRRYEELTARRCAEILTSEEHQELLRLTDRMERSDAERARALAELAQLRNVSMVSLMNQLGIRPRPYA